MIARRQVLAGLAAAPLFATPSFAEDDWKAVIEGIIANTADPVFLGATPLPPHDPRWDKARTYLASSPTSGTPYDVAKYLNDVLPTEFRKEWDSTYANPLIVLLFAATGTKPAGDTTAWCAAFMSWCVERVGLQSSHSAASRAYREFGHSIWSKGDDVPPTAPEGSIAVFRNQSDPSHGHVAFYVGPDPQSSKRVRVLGGNQGDAIGVSSFRIDNDLELYSIRSA